MFLEITRDVLFFGCFLEIQIKPTSLFCLQTSCGTEPNFWKAAFGPVSHGLKSLSDQPIAGSFFDALTHFSYRHLYKRYLIFCVVRIFVTHQSIDLRPVGLFCLLEVSFHGLSTSQRSFGRISTQPGDLWCRGGFLEVKCFKSGCLGDVGKVLEKWYQQRIFQDSCGEKCVRGDISLICEMKFILMSHFRCFVFGQNLRTKHRWCRKDVHVDDELGNLCISSEALLQREELPGFHQLMEEFFWGILLPPHFSNCSNQCSYSKKLPKSNHSSITESFEYSFFSSASNMKYGSQQLHVAGRATNQATTLRIVLERCKSRAIPVAFATWKNTTCRWSGRKGEI